MRHPTKRYMFFLAETLGMSIKEIQSMSSSEISEWMAYHLAQTEEFQNKYEAEQEAERRKTMTNEERARILKIMLTGKE